jgi:hypothetical protein
MGVRATHVHGVPRSISNVTKACTRAEALKHRPVGKLAPTTKNLCSLNIAVFSNEREPGREKLRKVATQGREIRL